MNKYKSLIALCCVTCGLTIHTNNLSRQKFSDMFDCMINDLREMEQLMDRAYQHTSSIIESFNKEISEEYEAKHELSINPSVHSPKIQIKIQQDDQENLKLSCKGISHENITATPVTKNLYSIKTPEADILIKQKNGFISITTESEENRELKQEDNKQLQQYGCSKSRVKHLINQPIDLSETAIDYNKDHKELVVSIPYAHKKVSN